MGLRLWEGDAVEASMNRELRLQGENPFVNRNGMRVTQVGLDEGEAELAEA